MNNISHKYSQTQIQDRATYSGLCVYLASHYGYSGRALRLQTARVMRSMRNGEVSLS